MPNGTSDSPSPGEHGLEHVSVGGYRLLLGDPSGAKIVPVVAKGEPSAQAYAGYLPLADAIEKERGERRSSSTPDDGVEGTVRDASEVVDKVQRAVTLFNDIAEHPFDLSSIDDEVEALVVLLRRLDHEKRFEEVLRVAHALAMLLGLIERWLELLHSLELALSAAEGLGDSASKAWALHELGTLNLAAGKDADADRMLGDAHELRRRARDTHGLEITEGNIGVLCRKLRAGLHNEGPGGGVLEWLMRRPAFAISLALFLLVVGGVAGAATHRARNAADTVSNGSSANGKVNAGGGKTTKGNTATGKTKTGKTATGKTPSPIATQPSIGSANTTTFEEGSDRSFTVTATGTPTPTVTETGKLPDGVTFNGGALSGVPTANGRFQIVFIATNSAGTVNQNFTLVVDPGRTVTTEERVTGTVVKPEAPSPRTG